MLNKLSRNRFVDFLGYIIQRIIWTGFNTYFFFNYVLPDFITRYVINSTLVAKLTPYFSAIIEFLARSELLCAVTKWYLTPIRSLIRKFHPYIQKFIWAGMFIYLVLYYLVPELILTFIKCTLASEFFTAIVVPLSLFVTEITCPPTEEEIQSDSDELAKDKDDKIQVSDDQSIVTRTTEFEDHKYTRVTANDSVIEVDITRRYTEKLSVNDDKPEPEFDRAINSVLSIDRSLSITPTSVGSQAVVVEEIISLTSSERTDTDPNTTKTNGTQIKDKHDKNIFKEYDSNDNFGEPELNFPNSSNNSPSSQPMYIYGNNISDFTNTIINEEDLNLMNDLSEGITKSILSLYQIITSSDPNSISLISFSPQEYTSSQSWKVGTSTHKKYQLWPKTEQKFKEYSPKVMKHLRELYKIDDIRYASSFEKMLLTKTSAGYTYYSSDKMFIMKPFSQEEFMDLKSSLAAYYDHLLSYPDSSLPRYCGFYKYGGVYYVTSMNTRTNTTSPATLAKDSLLSPIYWTYQGVQNQAEF